MSTATSKENKATALGSVQALIAGAEKHFPNGNFTLGSTAYTTASLVQILRELADAFVAVNAAHTAIKDALTELHALEAKAAPIMRDFRSVVRGSFSNAAATLADFGLTPPKAPRPLNSDERAVATAKARATRKARGTTSKKQKLAIKGDVTGVIVTPVRSHPAPAPTAAPAAPAPAVNAPAGTTK